MLDDILAEYRGLSAVERAVAAKDILKQTAAQKWFPTPGPQSEAYFSHADLLLYGGAGGSGKSDLGLGLAMTAHRRSLIVRRMYSTLSGLTERCLAINGTRDGFNGSAPPLLRTADGRYIQFAGNQHAGDEAAWQGIPFDLKVFDEGVQLLESQVRFHFGWLRTEVQGQRVRAVIATNPPLNSDGDWVIHMFRPWLDLTYPKPAPHGELRWFVTTPDGADLEVDGPTPIVLAGGDGKTSIPTSRTFIPGKLVDNPYLAHTGYAAQLDGLQEPLRSAVRDGNFMASRQDAEFQLIPTAWVIAAQGRWVPTAPKGVAMTAMAVDPAGGGADEEAIAYRYGWWYAPLQMRKGATTKDGSAAAALVVTYRRDSCPVIVDAGGGFAGAVLQRLADNGTTGIAFDGAKVSSGKTNDGARLSFGNKRAEAWWKFREALCPDQEGGSPIALPTDPELRSDLTAPTWSLTARGIMLESKDDIRKRLNRSPGKGDAVVMCFHEGERAQMRSLRSGGHRHLATTANMGFKDVKKVYWR